jgi:large subunit ribosomal protein L6
MSRIGNKPIEIPSGVEIKIAKNLVSVKGPKGNVEEKIKTETIAFEIKDSNLLVSRTNDEIETKSMHGLYRSLIYNMIEGVTKGFTKELELVGVGYRASNQGQKLDLALGFSHNILLDIASEVTVETISEKGKNPIIKLSSYDKQLVGFVASKIRSFRPPEPYKGKGVKFVGEQIRRKAGKSA